LLSWWRSLLRSAAVRADDEVTKVTCGQQSQPGCDLKAGAVGPPGTSTSPSAAPVCPDETCVNSIGHPPTLHRPATGMGGRRRLLLHPHTVPPADLAPAELGGWYQRTSPGATVRQRNRCRSDPARRRPCAAVRWRGGPGRSRLRAAGVADLPRSREEKVETLSAVWGADGRYHLISDGRVLCAQRRRRGEPAEMYGTSNGVPGGATGRGIGSNARPVPQLTTRRPSSDSCQQRIIR
jgi:hypothetical protein